MVVRIQEIVMKFISCLRNKSRSKDFKLSEYEIDKARNYFFKEGTSEVKHFNKESFYSKLCEEKDEILLSQVEFYRVLKYLLSVNTQIVCLIYAIQNVLFSNKLQHSECYT